ncbi:MAG: YidC/Oxa1 family membrane protein insertase [Longimicrobiales bacterium]
MGQIWDGLRELLGTILAFFYDLVPNFGVAIILLTIAISLLLFPLTLKQTRSMRAMSGIQPQVKALQAKHKDDREKLYAELQELYKEEGVSPAAGCLPLVLQMPIWFALFQVLREPAKFVTESSDLRSALDAGDTGFLTMDLLSSPSDAFAVGISDAIPYIILIIVVMATGYYQQYQTTKRQSGQQTQQAAQMQTIMKIFPVVFGFISWGLPGGLVLYFAVSQMFRIGQQAAIISIDGHHEAPAEVVETTETLEAPPAQPRQSKKRKRKKRK